MGPAGVTAAAGPGRHSSSASAGTPASTVTRSRSSTRTSGAPLVRVEDLDRVTVEAGVPAEALDEWRPGPAAAVTPAGPIALPPRGAGPRPAHRPPRWLLPFPREGSDG